ncbi:MAG: hypothetical protein M1835_007826 [Candelina submexicana]|nr:MAG: hypothetical protein M1835_007826 [Candelina submexicana]
MSSFSLILASLLALLPLSSAIRLIESKSLNPCQAHSNFTASLFNVIFTPDNNTLTFDVVGVSSIRGNVTIELEVIAYGFNALQQKLNPCEMDLSGLCPMSTGQININSNLEVGADAVKQIPGIAYGVPDLDGVVRIHINDTDTGTSVACLEAQLSNGKTVDLKGIGWSTAVVAGLALIVSAVVSGLGHSNTAAHIAANALSLFGYFQAQAMIGMVAVTLPPIVQSWTQNFDWSMGLIRVGFMQDIVTWYQRATGGKPTTLLSNLSTVSVQIQKRSEAMTHKLFLRAYDELVKRSNIGNGINEVTSTIVVSGIKRYGFRAGIESTNIFLTGLVFFIVFVMFVAIGIAAFKGFCEMAVKAGWLKGDKFQDFRNGWKLVMKGILFRLALIGYPQICILCLWEFTQRDSAAEVVLALMFFASLTLTLLWAALKVIRIAKRSVEMHKNPAYILYSDPKVLNKWGFLYVQFRATAYYFILPFLGYILLKAIFIAFAQANGIVQAIGLVIIEAGALIAFSIIRPWMDRRTNAFNISIGAVNFLNVIFLLVFTKVFNQKPLVTGVMGVIFFIVNAAFALILLLLVLASTIVALVSKNPDTRYQPMRDDRGSFIKSQTNVNTELDALGATARGDMKGPYKSRDIDDDDDSWSSDSMHRQQRDASGVPLPPSTANSHRPPSNREPPHSPVDPSVPLFPSHSPTRHGQSPGRGDNSRNVYHHHGYNDSQHGSHNGLLGLRSNTASPAPRGDTYSPYSRTGSSHSNVGYRQQNSASPWQRGAGYEH